MRGSTDEARKWWKEVTKKQEQQYLSLLDLLFRVSAGTKRVVTADPNRLRDAEGLGVKFAFHSASIFYLTSGTIIEDFSSEPLNYVDFASISVIARAAFEALLTFHHVFVSPQTDQDREFRYWAWLLSGLCERQKFPATLEKHQKQSADEKKQIEDLHKKLYSNSIFVSLSEKQKDSIKKGRWWQLKGWKRLARDAGLNQLHASVVYGYLCGYAHSDSLSVLQVHGAKSKEQQDWLSGMAVKYSMIATANMVFLYCHVFPDGKNTLAENPEAKQIAMLWRELGRAKTTGDKDR